MAQAGFTPISLYYSTTASAVPLAANLVPGELAINTADGKLYFENSSGVVTLLAQSSAASPVTTFSAGTTGFTPSTATSGAVTLAGTLAATNGGTGQSSYAVGDLLFASTTTALSKLADVATGNALISGGVGVAPAYGKIGLTTHVSGTLPTANGGTNLTSFTSGGAVYATSTSVLTTGTLPIASGGTNATATPTAGAVPYGTGTAYAFTAAGTAGQILQSNGAAAPTWINNVTGTVTTLSVVSANGLAGTVATATTTPAITLTTTVTGVLKGNGTAISAAIAGTDYLAPPSGTALLKANSGGALANATAGTDYVAPGTATTFTALQTFAGTASNADMKTSNIIETATVSATAATGTIAYDITTQSVLFYTSNASANWTVNFRGSAGTSLNTLMAIGESMSASFLVTQGATAYYNSAVQVDGTTSGVTTRWQGSAPTSGNASSLDSYTYVIIKTANATFTVLATQTKFA
jgi:hypothetical protein